MQCARNVLALTVAATLLAAATECATPPPAETILIKGGTVVNADRQFEADVLIRNGLIAEVGPGLEAAGARVIDASGQLVMPGGIDPHTHLEMPFMGQVACDDFASGQAAALAGGTTMHIDFALPVAHDLLAGFETWRKKAARSVMDYGFHMAVTSWSDKVSHDMETLATRHGINSFKFFMAYKGALMVSDAELLAGLQRCRALGALAMVHAENGDAVAEGQKRVFEAGVTGPEGHQLSRPALLEGEATGRAIRLARFVNAPLYVVHVMSSDAAAEVAAARAAGQRVIGEAVSSGISMDDSRVWDEDFVTAASYVMSPPIRGPAHRQALRRALAGGTLQLLGTDHAVFNSTQKAVGQHDFRLIPNGVNGIEERMHVAWQELVVSGLVTPSDYVRITSTEAARTFNVYPRKGCVCAGSDADVIVLDPRQAHVLAAASHHSRMDTNIYEGYRVRGKVVVTVAQGRVVWANGQLSLPEEGSGRFVPLPTFGPLFEGLDAQDGAWAQGEFPYGPTPVKRGAVRVEADAHGRLRVVRQAPGDGDEEGAGGGGGGGAARDEL